MKNVKPHIVAIIPSRYASTRLHAKALVDLCGKPMIQHVVEQTRRAMLVDRVIVATDDERIAAVVRACGGEVAMTPAELRSGSDRIAYLAKSLTDTDIIVNVQGDEPLIAPEMIDQAVSLLIPDSTIQVGTLIRKITTAEEMTNPGVVKVVLDANGYAMYFSRSPIPHLRDGGNPDQWHTQHLYYKHIGLYVYCRELLLKFAEWGESTLEQIEKLEQLRILDHGYKIKTAVTEYDSVPVDTADDVERVKTIMLNHNLVKSP